MEHEDSSYLHAIIYTRGELRLLDQLLIPQETVYVDIRTSEEGWHAIQSMKVRGAPAIAIAAALSLAVELHHRCNEVRSLFPVRSLDICY